MDICVAVYLIGMLFYMIDTFVFLNNGKYKYRRLDIAFPSFPDRSEHKPMIGQYIHFFRLYRIKYIRREFNKLFVLLILQLVGGLCFSQKILLISGFIIVMYMCKVGYVFYEVFWNTIE